MSNPEERACCRREGPDCKYLTTVINFWCTNEDRANKFGTTIPGVINCPCYEPKVTLQESLNRILEEFEDGVARSRRLGFWCSIVTLVALILWIVWVTT